MARALFLCGVSFSRFTSDWSLSEQRYDVDRHGQLALKQLRLSVQNEKRRNSYTGPRLKYLRHYRHLYCRNQALTRYIESPYIRLIKRPAPTATMRPLSKPCRHSKK